MILSYYNILLLQYNQKTVEFKQQQLLIMRQYLQELFANYGQQRQIEIRIGGLDVIKQSIAQHTKKLLVGLLNNMQPVVYQVNGRYTVRQQTKLIYSALTNIEVKESRSRKQAVQLQNLHLLKQYYSEYKSQPEMKLFLKNLLIEEISTQKKTIKYRQAQQVIMLIRVMGAQIEGEINITCQSKQMDEQNRNKIIVWMLLESRDNLKSLTINQLITRVEREYRVNKEVNRLITNNLTIKQVAIQSQTLLKKIVNQYYCIKSKQYTTSLQTLKAFSHLLANIRAVKQFGMKLWQQQQSLNQQFLRFVQEMKFKYSAVLQQYLLTYKQHRQYILKQQKYKKYMNSCQIINIYIVTVNQMRVYNTLKQTKHANFCRMVQNNIRSFLIVKRQQQKQLDGYMQRKNIQLIAQNKLYEQIRQLYNQYQLDKLTKFNKYKYGFACTTHIINIKNYSSYTGFAAQRLLQFIERLNRRQQPVVKLKCEQSYLQATTVEGRTYVLGCKKNNRTTNDSNKQNISYFNISNKSSAISSNYNSKTSQLSAFNRISISQSNVNSKWHSLQIYSKEGSVNANKQMTDYEMKLDENGRLFAYGNNKFGQLGLGRAEYIANFTCILPSHKVKLFSTNNYHTTIITTQNKLFYCGRAKGKYQQSYTPTQIILKDKIVIKQLIRGLSDTYLLTDRHKIYSLNLMNFIIIAKPIELQMDHFHLVRTDSYNLQIVYLVAYWTNTLDKVQKQQIYRYLTNNNTDSQNENESLLVDNLCQNNNDIHRNNIGELSAILQSPLQ